MNSPAFTPYMLKITLSCKKHLVAKIEIYYLRSTRKKGVLPPIPYSVLFTFFDILLFLNFVFETTLYANTKLFNL